MSESQNFTFTAPEDLHMRPCGVIVKFAVNTRYSSPGVKLSLSNSSEKTAQARSVIELILLGIKKDDTFSLRIEQGTKEQVTLIARNFREQVVTKLGESHLHTSRQELLVPCGLKMREKGEKHPEYNKFQERYDFLSRTHKFFRENENYFVRPDALTNEKKESIIGMLRCFAEEERAMLERHRMSLYQGGDIIREIIDRMKEPSAGDEKKEYDSLSEYFFDSLLEARRYLGTVPDDIAGPIYHNINILLGLEKRMDHIESAESLIEVSDLTLESMLMRDKARIYIYMAHNLASIRLEYSMSVLPPDPLDSEQAFKNFKVNLNKMITEIVQHAQEFIYPMDIRTY